MEGASAPSFTLSNPGLLLMDYLTTVLLSHAKESTCKTRAQLALPRTSCSHHDKNPVIPCFIDVHGPRKR